MVRRLRLLVQVWDGAIAAAPGKLPSAPFAVLVGRSHFFRPENKHEIPDREANRVRENARKKVDIVSSHHRIFPISQSFATKLRQKEGKKITCKWVRNSGARIRVLREIGTASANKNRPVKTQDESFLPTNRLQFPKKAPPVPSSNPVRESIQCSTYLWTENCGQNGNFKNFLLQTDGESYEIIDWKTNENQRLKFIYDHNANQLNSIRPIQMAIVVWIWMG